MTSHVENWSELWDTYAEAAEKNPAQAYRRELIFDLLSLRRTETVRLLDIGSGQGDFCFEASQKYPKAEIRGLELSESGVRIAQEKVPQALFIQRDLMQPQEPPTSWKGWATHAVCSEVLEHVDHPEVFLKNWVPYLAPECRIAVTVPGGPRSAFDLHIGHRKHFTQASFRALVEKSGFEIETLQAAGFPFLNLYRLTVIARGKKLIEDVAKKPNGELPLLASVAMKAFSGLFKLNIPSSPFGWQIVSVIRKKTDV